MADMTVETTLFRAERAGHSTNGNPTWQLTTAHGTYKTQTDAACAYDVDNIRRTIPGDGEGVRVRLTMTKAERVWKIETL